jgi:hypothetical protein
MEFWPAEGSPLIDAGRPIAGFSDAYHGKAPDIGAYEYGGPRWVPGIRWDPQQELGHAPRGFIRVR